MRMTSQHPSHKTQPPRGPWAFFGPAIQAGDLVDAATFEHELRWSPLGREAALADGRIFCLDIDGTRYYPAFYYQAGAERRRFESVTRLLGALSSGSKWQFFANGKGSLGGLSPVQALRLGRYAAVRVAARGFAER